MADLTPTPDSPGLHVSKPSAYTPATGSYTCRCGDTASATGDDQVRALAETYTAQHGPAHRGAGAR